MFKLWQKCTHLTWQQSNAQNSPNHASTVLELRTSRFQAGFRKGRGTSDQIASIHWIIAKAREFQKNIYFHFIDYVKAFECVDHNKMQKILQEVGIPNHLTCLLINLYARQEETVRPDMKQQTGSKLGKEYAKAAYCHLAYLTYMQSTSCEMQGWIKHRLESRQVGEISITSDMQMIPL